MKAQYGNNIYWGTEFEINTLTYNVGDFKMKSEFDDAGWAVLGHEKRCRIRSEQIRRQALYWTYHDVWEDGSWGTEKEGEEIFDDFLFYTYSHASHTACKDNQVITEIHISDDIRRWFENRTIMGWKFIFQGNSANGVPQYVSQWVPTMMHRVVVSEDNEHEETTIIR